MNILYMPQKKKTVKKTIIRNNKKNEPILKKTINIKIDLDEENKKPRKRKQKKKIIQPLEQQLLVPPQNNALSNRKPGIFMTSPDINYNNTSNNLVDLALDKIKRLTTLFPLPAPPQLPQPTIMQQPAIIQPSIPSSSLPTSSLPPSTPQRPQVLNFNLDPTLTPLQASSLALNRVQQYALSSSNASNISQNTLIKIFHDIPDLEIAQIKRASVDVKDKYLSEIITGKTLGAQAMKFKSFFKTEYKGNLNPKEADRVAWEYFKILQ